ncbi:hypothetical protein ACHQM5_006812 [Ranunculus cassubicifolius]
MLPPSSHSASSQSHLLHSPIPYLFGGLAAMLVLIALSLLILVCTHRKSSASTESEDIEKGPKLSVQPPETEPKVIVIMAGDNMPTFIANPVSKTQHKQEGAWDSLQKL